MKLDRNFIHMAFKQRISEKDVSSGLHLYYTRVTWHYVKNSGSGSSLQI